MTELPAGDSRQDVQYLSVRIMQTCLLYTVMVDAGGCQGLHGGCYDVVSIATLKWLALELPTLLTNPDIICEFYSCSFSSKPVTWFLRFLKKRLQVMPKIKLYDISRILLIF